MTFLDRGENLADIYDKVIYIYIMIKITLVHNKNQWFNADDNDVRGGSFSSCSLRRGSSPINSVHYCQYHLSGRHRRKYPK